MGRLLPVLLIFTLCLAACGGETPTPTATPEPPTATQDTVEAVLTPMSQQEVLALPTGIESSVDIPMVGTLTYNDPDLAATGLPTNGAPFSIETVNFDQQGGITGSTLSITLFADGRVLRNGVESRVSPEAVAQIEAMLNEIRFFNIAGMFETGAMGADQFRYAITVDSALGSRTIISEDGLTPAPLLALYDAIKALGQE